MVVPVRRVVAGVTGNTRGRGMNRSLFVGMLLTASACAGCATSRYDQLRSRSRQVERSLVAERDRTLSLPATEHRQRLDHLSSMRLSLTATDIGLAAVRRLVPEVDRPLAYDAIEEAYDTIEWNIPLLPGRGTRPLPDAFRGGVFDVNRFVSPRD